MVWVRAWLKPRARRVVGPGPQVSPEAPGEPVELYESATNVGRQVIEIVRPHLATGACLIVTGYQDFFSSLSIILREIPDISARDGAHIRIAFGIDTGNAPGFAGRGRTIGEAVKAHFLSQRGLAVEDAADLQAILAADAIRAGVIDLRVFDLAFLSRVSAVHVCEDFGHGMLEQVLRQFARTVPPCQHLVPVQKVMVAILAHREVVN